MVSARGISGCGVVRIRGDCPRGLYDMCVEISKFNGIYHTYHTIISSREFLGVMLANSIQLALDPLN